MTYRIALHFLSVFWNSLLLIWAISLRHKHRYYRSVALLSMISVLYSLSWAIGLLLESLWWMRFTWVGALLPAALLQLVCHLVDDEKEQPLLWVGWSVSALVFIGGLTPWCIKQVVSYEPYIQAVVGPIEPALRVAVGVVILSSLWLALRHRHQKLLLAGYFLYAIAGIISAVVFPLFGDYRFLEGGSYGAIIWTSLAMWHVVRELNQLDIMKKNLINHVTHEFRTPLHTIQSALEMLRDNPARPDYVEMVQKNAAKLEHFVNELLDVAKIQQAKITLNKSECDAHTLAAGAIELVRPMATAAGVTLTLAGAPTPLHADAEKIEQILSNLLSNAIKASPNGHVTVTTTTSNGSALIEVSDNGCGIDPADLKNIFECFFQAESKKTAVKGSGLGLAIAKGWVQAHGGKIWAESDGVGRGMRVKVALPIIKAEI